MEYQNLNTKKNQRITANALFNMKHKTRMQKNSEAIDRHHAKTGEITEESTAKYHKILAKIYDYESETIFKRDKPERYIK